MKSMTTIWESFEALAQHVGHVDALLAPGRAPLLFADIPERLVEVRDVLASYGVGPRDRVAAALPQGPETAVCYLGVAACATYVPLNPEYSESEFSAYFADLKPKALILPDGANNRARNAAESRDIPIIDLLPELERPAGTFSLRCRAHGWTSTRPEWTTAEDIALILLTSGTTSRQKIVPNTQRQLLGYARCNAEHYSLRSEDRCLHVMPMFHGHGLKSTLMGPLVSGSGVICPPKFDIPSFFEHMDTFRPTWYSAAASIHQAIADRIDEYRDVVERANLRFIRSGSSRLSPKVMRKLEGAFGVPVIERYGSSETCTLTANPMPPGIRKPGTVGKVVAGEVAIMDENGNILGPNCDGEVVARGGNVFDGYLDNPEANAAAFIDGWFRTGDLGRFDDDGYLTLIGRLKQVINRGGEKIGTTEVEAAISGHPAVEEVCVFSIPHRTLGEEVAAAVVASGDQSVTASQIREHALRRLAGFKVPRRVFFLPSLPKGATNKVKRADVARICLDILARENNGNGSRNRSWSALEREVARMWAAVLGIALEEIGPDDDFFLIGGDSLRAFELFLLLEKHYRIQLGLRHIFDEAATVPGMARLVRRAREGGLASEVAAAGLVHLKNEGDRPPLFAVPGSGGNPLGFVHLARQLDERQPMIGIESRGMDGSMMPLNRMEKIAADNVSRIKTVQPVGPYFLTGACYGARVAYEMARQLEAAGDSIGLLLMLDPSAPFHNANGTRRGSSPPAKPTGRHSHLLRFVTDRIKLHAGNLVRLRGAERSAYVREKLKVIRGIIQSRDLFRGDRTELYQQSVYLANRQAGRAYVPGHFGGATVICFSRGRPVKGPRNFRLDWQELVPQSGTPTLVSGRDSGDMTNVPHVYELAPLVNRWLDEAHSTARAPSGAENVG